MPATSLLLRAPARDDAVSVCVRGRPVLSLALEHGRVRVGLVMHPLDRVVDVSVQPSAACATLRDAADRSGEPWSTAEGAARAALATAHDRCGSWSPGEGIDLLGGVGGAAFPMLGAAYGTGATPLGEVPRWAEPVLAQRTVRDAAGIAFGDRVTRPVVRALVEALGPGSAGEVGLGALALAMIGRTVLEPDRLARVLGAPRAAHPVEHLPDPTTLDHARLVVDTWGPARAERALTDAAAAEDGLKLLLETVQYARQLRGHAPSVLPHRLGQLHDLHRCRVATAPPPRPSPAPHHAPRRVVEAPAPPPPPRAVVDRIFAPARGLAPVPPDTVLPATAAVGALHGRHAGELTFVIPRTAGDLERWGRLLANCLGGFGAMVAARRCAIVGVERAGALAFAIEVRADGVVQQFAGQANRRPDEATRLQAVRALAEAGVVAADHPGNAPWLAGSPPAGQPC